MKKLELHPLCAIFPALEETEIASLAEDIAAHGQRKKIVTLDGKILDGQNRYAACLRIGIAPKLEKFTGKSALDFVISENLKRRHLSESQRALIAAELAKLRPGEKGDGATLGVKDTAALLNVSERSVRSGKRVRAKGSKQVRNLVRDGKVSISAAEKVSHLPKKKQAAIAARGGDAVTRAASKLTQRGGFKPGENLKPLATNRKEFNPYASGATSTTPEFVRGQRPPPVASTPASAELAPVTDSKSAALRLETIYERDKAWFNFAAPPRTPRAIVDKLIEGMRE